MRRSRRGTARAASGRRLTDDGIHLTADGLRRVAAVVARSLGAEPNLSATLDPVRTAIMEKNRLWFDCWRPANWSFVYGDRMDQKFGQAGAREPSLREAFERQRPWVEKADALIHALSRGAPAVPLLLPRLAPSPEEAKALSPDRKSGV